MNEIEKLFVLDIILIEYFLYLEDENASVHWWGNV